MNQDPPAKANRDILTAAKGGGIIFFGRLFEYGSRFIFGIIVARSLGADGFGLYNLGVSTAITLAGIAMLGLPSGMVRFLPIALRERDESRVWGTLQTGLFFSGAIGLGLAVMVFGLADFVAENFFHEPQTAAILRWISLCIPLTAMGRILMATTRAFKRMHYQVYADSITFNLSKIGLSVLFISVGFGASGVMAAHTLAWIIEVGLLFFFLNRLFNLKRPLNPARRNIKEIIYFSFPLFLTRLVKDFGSELELLILGFVGTVASMGVYSAALRIQLVGIMFLGAAQEAAMPIISDLYHQEKRIQLRQLYQTLTRWSLTFILPFFLTVILFAKPILAIFGKDFQDGVPALIIINIGTLVNAGTGICGGVIDMTGHSKLSFVNSLVGLIIILVFDVLLVPAWGVMGAATAAALSIATVNIARLIQVYWLHKLWPYNRGFVKPFIAGAIALAVGLVVHRLIPSESNLVYLAFNVAVLWSSFIGATMLLGLSEEDHMLLSSTRKKFSAVLVRH